jgi:hypothetical protein
MSDQAAHRSVLPLKLLAHQTLAKARASETDMSFIQDVHRKDNCPEYNGYNTAISRNQGHTLQPKTRAVYLPLIDMKSSDPDTS